MLTIEATLAASLKAGATLVVPSRQRAAAVRMAVAAEAYRGGLRVWPSPDVLPWQGWLTREFEERRHALGGQQRLLGSTEAWFVWRGIAARLAEAQGLLSPGGLARALPRSVARLRDWGLRWSGDAGAEAGLLRLAQIEWQRACRGLEAVDPTEWSALPEPPAGAPVRAVRLAGFATPGSARRAWLAARGVTVAAPPAGPLAPLVVHAAADPADEYQAAAAWCRDRLSADPEVRLLVIAPGLERHRARLQRLFNEALDPAGEATGPAAFAIEGGQPLAEFALVRAALQLLALDLRPVAFAELSALLRTPCLGLGPAGATARLDLWLRDRNLGAVDLARLRALLPAVARDLGAAEAAVVERLLEGLPAGPAIDAPGGWARRYVARLRAAGWPGAAPLGSAQQQVRRRFDELLGEFAAAGGVVARREAGPALQLFEGLARETAYEPASDDVPVTISARMDDPLVRYDGIWVCGCDASRLPAPPSPDPFIPLGLQLGAGVPEASADGQLLLARAALAAWRAATPELVLSWARTDDDAEQGPSGLLAGGRAWDGAGRPTLLLPAAPLESLADERGSPWPADQRLRGGVQALQWQSECPFRAYAQLRLGADAVPEPAPGVDPRLRGRVLHRALETVWKGLGDSAALQALAPAQQAARVTAAVAVALAQELEAGDVELPALLQEAERARTAAVIGALLDAERERAPFRVLATELRRPLQLGARPLGLRLDRVDVLADGSVAILDYKTGRPEGFDPHAERLRRPQLPGYALAWGEGVSALASVHLRRDGVKWRGVADADGRLPQVRAAVAAASGWPELHERWRAALGGLLAELSDGNARVAPLPRACDDCHLAALCRIDAARQAPPDTGDGEGGDDG